MLIVNADQIAWGGEAKLEENGRALEIMYALNACRRFRSAAAFLRPIGMTEAEDLVTTWVAVANYGSMTEAGHKKLMNEIKFWAGHR
jgi:hypothetical protein